MGVVPHLAQTPDLQRQALARCRSTAPSCLASEQARAFDEVHGRPSEQLEGTASSLGNKQVRYAGRREVRREDRGPVSHRIGRKCGQKVAADTITHDCRNCLLTTGV